MHDLMEVFMYANIDKGKMGISKNDMQVLNTRLKNGEQFSAITKQLAQKASKESWSAGTAAKVL